MIFSLSTINVKVFICLCRLRTWYKFFWGLLDNLIDLIRSKKITKENRKNIFAVGDSSSSFHSIFIILLVDLIFEKFKTFQFSTCIRNLNYIPEGIYCLSKYYTYDSKSLYSFEGHQIILGSLSHTHQFMYQPWTILFYYTKKDWFLMRNSIFVSPIITKNKEANVAHFYLFIF